MGKAENSPDAIAIVLTALVAATNPVLLSYCAAPPTVLYLTFALSLLVPTGILVTRYAERGRGNSSTRAEA